jgi:putative flippase GtrA
VTPITYEFDAFLTRARLDGAMSERARSLPTTRSRVFNQLCRFATVGVANTLLSYAFYTGLVAARVPYPVAGAAGFAAGALNGYILNRRWTFACSDTAKARARYLVVQFGGLGATTALLWLVVTLGATGRLLGYALTIPIVTLATFSVNRSWTFADPPVAG